MVFKSGRALAAALLATGCIASSPRPILVAGPLDLARGSERYPDLTADELATGRTLFAGRCTRCHPAPEPVSLSPEAWPAQVAEMKVRAHLDASQSRLIERYLVTMALGSQSESGSSR